MLYKLAWFQLIAEKKRLLAALAGISFAVLLELMQFGFRDALFTSATLIHSRLVADIVLISPQYQYLLSPGTFSQRRLYQTLGLSEVESVAPVYFSAGPLKNTETGAERQIFVLGFNPDEVVLNVPSIVEKMPLVKVPDVAIYDALARPDFGPIPEQVRDQHSVTTEIAGRRTTIGGTFNLGISFAATGTIVMSDASFRRRFNRPEGVIELGLIRLKPGSNVAAVQATLRRQLQPDVQVLTRQEFSDIEQRYWDRNTPIGFVFFMGEVIGIFVGAVIVYQILYTDVNDHLTEYATLKAMGYTNWQLNLVVLEEALILSVCSFPIGLGLSQILYTIARNSTHLPIMMSTSRVALVLGLTILMCGISGIMATQKLRSADPADVF